MKMTIDQIKDASAREFTNAKKDAAESTETVPAELTDRIKSFAATLGGEAPAFVPVIRDAYGLFGFCVDGVREKIAADSGSIAFGWAIWEWPGAMLTAEFHAVWRDTEGALFDITPKPGGEARILFVHDPAYPQDFDFDQRPLNRRARIYDGADPSDDVARLKAQLKGGRLRYEERRAARAGLPLDEWLMRKVAPDPRVRLIDQAIEACDAFEAYFDTLGGAGYVRPDDTLMALMKRRVQTVLALKAQLKTSKVAEGKSAHG